MKLDADMIAKLVAEVGKALEDGKISIFEAIAIVKVVLNIIKA